MNSLLLAFHNAFNISVCTLIEQNGVFLKKKKVWVSAKHVRLNISHQNNNMLKSVGTRKEPDYLSCKIKI